MTIADMSIRDWFAGQALTGLLARQQGLPLFGPTIVQSAYQIADAMMEEQAKQSSAARAGAIKEVYGQQS
jgi:hypothetical protein